MGSYNIQSLLGPIKYENNKWVVLKSKLTTAPYLLLSF